MNKPRRHILGLSGGKDSAALAVFLRDRVPEMEYVFCDTGKELEETYEYLGRLEAYLGKKIRRLNDERGFDHWLKVYGGYLPSGRMRWCTRMLKLKPFEDYVGTDEVINYVGIRADEDREGYISTKPNITSVFPFRDAGVDRAQVLKILADAGLGLPKYYEWRSRSGCFFCFFQRREEWVQLKLRHPDLFEQAKAYEKVHPETGERYTWSSVESLAELERPERLAAILGEAERRRRLASKSKRRNLPLIEVLAPSPEEHQSAEPDDAAERACLICEL